MDEREARRFRLQLMALHRRLRAEHVQSIGLQAILTLGAIDRLGVQASPSTLAADLSVARPNMSTLLRQLESKGLLVTARGADDGRRRGVSLTEAGRRLLEQDRDDRERWLRQAAHEVLSAAEVELLMSAGELMQRLAEAPGAAVARDDADQSTTRGDDL